VCVNLENENFISVQLIDKPNLTPKIQKARTNDDSFRQFQYWGCFPVNFLCYPYRSFPCFRLKKLDEYQNDDQQQQQGIMHESPPFCLIRKFYKNMSGIALFCKKKSMS